MLEENRGVLRRLRRHVLQAIDRRSKAQDAFQRRPRFLVRFLHELGAAPFLQEIRDIALRQAQFCIQGHHFLTLGFPRGIDVALKRRRAEGRDIGPRPRLGQAPKRFPLVLDLLRLGNALFLLLDERGDGCTPRLHQIDPRHLLDFMDRIAPLGSLLNFVQQLRENLGRLAEPILNLDNHPSGSWDGTVKHRSHASMFYPGALYLSP